MSTLFYKMLGAPNVKYSKHVVVATVRENLAEYVRKAMEGVDYREVAHRSGGAISHTTVFDVVNQRSKDIKVDTLIGLAKGLGVSEDELFAVARGKELTEDEQVKIEKDRFWALYSDIPPQCQKDVMDLLEVLQKNHSIRDRLERRTDRREIAATSDATPRATLESVPTRPAEADANPSDAQPSAEPRVLPEIPYSNPKHGSRKKENRG